MTSECVLKEQATAEKQTWIDRSNKCCIGIPTESIGYHGLNWRQTRPCSNCGDLIHSGDLNLYAQRSRLTVSFEFRNDTNPFGRVDNLNMTCPKQSSA